MDKKILEKLGLTNGEIKVFLSLLKIGNATTGPIVDDSGISKSKVYEILERLRKKGLVSQIIENNTKYFQAVNPQRLLELYEEKENELKDFKQDLIKILPSLESQYSSKKEKQEATVFRGYNGIKSIFQDMLHTLNEKDELIVFVAVETPDFLKPFFEEFTKQRERKKIKVKIITTDLKIVAKTKDKSLTKAKKIGSEFNTPAVFNLYKNKSAIILWSKEPIGILIENKEITNSFKKYFDVLWKISK